MKLIARSLSVAVLFVLPLCAQNIEEAKEARKSGNHERCIELLREDISATVKSAEALQMLTDSLLQIGEYDSAVGHGQQLVKLAPDSAKSHKLCCQAFYFRAEESKNDPGATSAKVEGFYEGAVRFARSGAKVAPDDAEFASYEGHGLYWLNQPKESAEAFERAAKLNSKDADLLYFAARSWLAGKEAGKAQKASERACQANPNAAWLHRQLAEICGVRQDWEGATKAFGKAFELAGGSEQSARPLADAVWPVLGNNGRMAEAAQVMKAWTDAHPRLAFAWLFRGWYVAQLGQMDEAKQVYQKCFEVSGNRHGGAAVELAQLLQKSGDYEGASEWMLKAHRSGFDFGADVNSHPKRRLLGIYAPLVNERRYEQVVGYIERYGLKMDRGDWKINNALGFLCRDWAESMGAGRNPGGKKLCKRSIDYYEKSLKAVMADRDATGTEQASVHNDLALMFHYPRYGHSDVDRASKLYRKALELDPTYIDALENLGLVLLSAGKFEEAKGLFEQVLEAQPGRRVSMMGKRRAEQGQGGGR